MANKLFTILFNALFQYDLLMLFKTLPNEVNVKSCFSVNISYQILVESDCNTFISELSEIIKSLFLKLYLMMQTIKDNFKQQTIKSSVVTSYFDCIADYNNICKASGIYQILLSLKTECIQNPPE